MQEKKYRPNVAAVILSPKYPEKCEIFIAQRCDIKGAWQFPQGGIDEGETPKEALFRELKEEIGSNEIEILSSYPEWLSYDFPANSPHRYNYAGQKQKYFLVRLKDSSKIDLNVDHPEFDAYKFVKLNEFFSLVNHFKKPIYRKVLKYFREKGYI